jgi:hypothetical protein
MSPPCDVSYPTVEHRPETDDSIMEWLSLLNIQLYCQEMFLILEGLRGGWGKDKVVTRKLDKFMECESLG